MNAPRATKRKAAASAAATPPFMSAAPRPHSAPSASVAENGGKRQRAESPGGTTSVWPAKAKFGASRPKRAQRLAIVGVPASANETISTAKPASASRRCT